MTTTENAFISAVKNFKKLAQAAKDATSEANKAKTSLKNSLIAYRKQNDIDPAATLQVDDEIYAYAPAIAEKINPKLWYDLLKRREISEEQFFDAISVSVTEAKTIVGEDRVIAMRETVIGKTYDVRITKAEDTTPFRVHLPAKAKTVKARKSLVKTDAVEVRTAPARRVLARA